MEPAPEVGARARPLLPLALAAFAGCVLGGAAAGEVPLGLRALSGANEGVDRTLRELLPVVALLGAVGAALRVATDARGRWLVASCVALGLACAARATTATTATTTAGAQASAAAPGATWVGTWRAAPGVTDGSRGRLDGAGPLLRVEGGTLVGGERVAVRPSAEPLRAARGPVPRPGLSAGPRTLQPVLPDEVVRLAPPPAGGPAWLDLPGRMSRARRSLAESLAGLSNPRTAGLVSALVVGDPGQLPAGASDLFARTGTMHLLAVSGLHVALVAWLLVGPFGSLVGTGLRRLLRGAGRSGGAWIDDVARVALLAAYVPLAGARPPVVRAAVAFGLASLARHVPARRAARGGLRLGRRPDARTLWATALLFECVVNPRAYASASVGLSYGATLGLIVGYGPLRAALMRRLPGRGRVAPVSRLGRARPAALRAVWQRTLEGAVAALAASCAAVLGGLPVAWTTFGELSPAGIVATPLLVPLLALLIVGGWTHATLPGVDLETVLEVLARAAYAVLAAFDELPGTPLVLPPRPFFLVALAVGFALAALAALGTQPGRARPRTRVAAGLGGLLLVPWSATPASLELFALDVGNGSAVVMRGPGLGTWVFDAGSRDRFGVARSALAPLLASWETGPVAVVLSHRHRDHLSGLSWLVERYPIRLWAGALPAHLGERLPHGTPTLDAGPGRVALPAPDPRCAVRLELWRGSDEHQEDTGSTGNEVSRTLVVDFCGERIVLSGDAEEHGLAALLDAGALDGPCRVLLAPHHGSETRLLGRLLARADPAEVWISSSGSPPIAAELERRAIPWRWTGRDGPLGLSLKNLNRSGRPSGTEGASGPPETLPYWQEPAVRPEPPSSRAGARWDPAHDGEPR